MSDDEQDQEHAEPLPGDAPASTLAEVLERAGADAEGVHVVSPADPPQGAALYMLSESDALTILSLIETNTSYRGTDTLLHLARLAEALGRVHMRRGGEE